MDEKPTGNNSIHDELGRIPVQPYEQYISGIEEFAERKGVSLKEAANLLINQSNQEAGGPEKNEHKDLIESALNFLVGKK